MVIAQITTDNREPFREYHKPVPWFGAAPEALLQGFALLPDIKVHVISCAQKPMVSSPEKLADNIWFHSLVVPKTGWLRTGYQGCVRAIRHKIREIAPDMVHGQGTERECSLGAIFSGRPNVVTIHGNMAELARMFRARPGSYGWLAARLENFTLRRTAGVFCNSAYTERLVLPRARRAWRVANPLRNAFFETPVEAAPASRPCVLLNIGVVSPRKRQLELLDVAQTLRKRGVRCEFHFIGRADPSDPYAAAFLERVKSMEETGFIRFLGGMPVEKLIHHFDTADGIVHFPNEEAFGLTVAEGLARNLKLFGAGLGGILDIAEGVQGAELFEENDWEGLTTAIARWVTSGHPRPAGTAAIMKERYHPQVVAGRHLKIYREVLDTSS